MYEISLVPDVKAELIQKQKIRNLIILVCVIVACACAGVILVMLSITGAQTISISGQENEISCRMEGTGKDNGKCSNTGEAILRFKNVNELLTIQDQMKSISALNANKVKFSRVFGILDVILPDGSANGDKVDISELASDASENMISFDAIGKSTKLNIGFHVLETFKKGVNRSYFDYGDYMRKNEDGEYVPIPSFCITEYTEKGYTYAKYTKGEPGCEAPMVKTTSGDTPSDEKDNQTSDSEEEKGEKEEGEKSKDVKKETIIIRRTYDDLEDLENYKNGNDKKKKDKEKNGSNVGYYFESQCMQYKDDGSFDEEATLLQCPLAEEDGIMIGSSSYGRGSDDEMVMSFSVVLKLDKRVFASGNKHMQVFGPSRQNVTDSYVEVRDMFTAKAKPVDTGEEK